MWKKKIKGRLFKDKPEHLEDAVEETIEVVDDFAPSDFRETSSETLEEAVEGFMDSHGEDIATSDNSDEVFYDEEVENEKNKTPWKDFSIYCDGLVKIYKTEELEVMALQGLELEIPRGEFMSIIGKSGSGKSTLMNIIGGLETPTVGRIYVEGQNLSDMTEKEKNDYRKNVIGFVWQKSERNLLQYLTSIENVMNPMNFTGMTQKQKREKAMNLLELVGMAHKKDSFPTQMSGGEQQRIAIAVALANDPKILLADEPTGAVDSKTSGEIQDLFRELNRKLNLTIIIVTHDMKLANKVDRVVMISDGKISTEKIMKQEYRAKIDSLNSNQEKDEAITEDFHEEFSVLDKANRVQLTKDILSEAGIDGNKVKIHVENGKVVISGKE